MPTAIAVELWRPVTAALMVKKLTKTEHLLNGVWKISMVVCLLAVLPMLYRLVGHESTVAEQRLRTNDELPATSCWKSLRCYIASPALAPGGRWLPRSCKIFSRCFTLARS